LQWFIVLEGKGKFFEKKLTLQSLYEIVRSNEDCAINQAICCSWRIPQFRSSAVPQFRSSAVPQFRSSAVPQFRSLTKLAPEHNFCFWQAPEASFLFFLSNQTKLEYAYES
jgi:hypothetical protein